MVYGTPYTVHGARNMALSKEQIQRYSRQLILSEIGVRGQERLLASSVLVIGAGGLGCPAALYLAAAGIGRIGILDRDVVALSNLHRQILHGTADVGRPKSESAKARLQALNPDVTIHAIPASLTPENAADLVQDFELVLDGSDNFPTRYLVNDACVLSATPFIYGGVVHLRGQMMVVQPGQSACFRCVFPEPPTDGAIPNCQDAGVVGATAGIIGSLMAHEAIKWLVGIGTPLTNRLLAFDGLTARVREIPVRRAADCAVCGEHPTIRTPASDGIACDPRDQSARAAHASV